MGASQPSCDNRPFICLFMHSLHTIIFYMSMYALHFLRTHENWTCYVIYVYTLLWMKGEILEPGYKTKQHCTAVLCTIGVLLSQTVSQLYKNYKLYCMAEKVSVL